MKNLEVLTRNLGNSPADQSVLIVADTTELAAVITTFLSDGTLVTLGDGSQYIFNANATTGGITPTTGTGRWWLLAPSGNGINAKTFGAIGDNVADDTTPLQNAINALANYGSLYIPKGTYKITASLTLGVGGVAGVLNVPITIYGDGNATQIINAAPINNPTFKFAGVALFQLRDVLLSGNSTNPNDAVWLTKNGNNQRCGGFVLKNVVSQMPGRGFYITDTNTGQILNCMHWPSGGGVGAVAPVVNLGDVSHGIEMGGTTAINDITIIDFVNPGSALYAAGTCSILYSSTFVGSTGIRVIGGELEGWIKNSGMYAIKFTGVYASLIHGTYSENGDIYLSGCRYISGIGIDGAVSKLTLTGNSHFCDFSSCYFDDLIIDAGSDANNFTSSTFAVSLTDNAADTVFLVVNGAGSDRVADRGRKPVAAAVYLDVPYALNFGVQNVAICNREDYDQFTIHNPATGEFTIPVSGNYRISVGGYVDNLSAAGKGVQVAIYKNGVTTGRRSLKTAVGAGQPVNLDMSAIIPLTKNDVVTISIYLDDVANRNLNECFIGIEAL